MQTATSQRRFFVIDPAEFQRRILGMLLREQGYESVVEASTAEECAELATNDVVFVDADSFSARLAPAEIVVTGPERSDETLARRIGEGAAAFLIKPFTKQGLERALRDLELMKS